MARSRSIRRKLRTLSGVGPRRQALVAEAAAGMLAARVAILLRPFGTLSRRFGVLVSPGDPRVTARPAATAREARVARDIGWAIRSAAPFMPFRSLCLQQAMAGHAMLKRRGIHGVMHFGAVGSTERQIDAHAWLDAGGVKVTGYPVAPTISELAVSFEEHVMDAADADILTHEMFEPHLGSGFAVRVRDHQDVLTLTEVTPVPAAMPGAVRPGFSLVFTGARSDIVFDQQMLDLVHPAMGTLAIMLTPIGRTAGAGACYQAVFN